MKKYWYRRILIMIVIFTAATGGSWYLIHSYRQQFPKEVSADTSDETMVIPGGMPVGIYLETEGVMVLGTDEIEGMDGNEYEPAQNLVQAGDYIVEMDGTRIHNKSELIQAVETLTEEDVVLTVVRNGRTIDVRTRAVQCPGGEYKLGIWVRDNTQGLGTITFLNVDSKFGALGHGIHDTDTSDLLDISEGTLYATSIKDIQKGANGTPGGMEGIIVYNNYNILGTVEKNTEEGIYGTIQRIDTLFSDQEPMETAAKEEIQEGPAKIRCAVEGEVKEYDIRITKIDTEAQEANKGLELEVTDQALLDVTGGIVQGMSGSPIIQNGKLVGAVTHVFVNDPAKGYGIFIENMLKNVE